MEALQTELDPSYRGYIFLILLGLIVIELIWSWKKEKKAYDVKDTMANLAILFGFQLSKILFFGIQFAILTFFSKLALFNFGYSIPIFVLSFVLVDFIYYWYHRLSHKIKFLWAFHLVHHSSLFMNLTVAYRLNWLSALLTPFVVAPLVIVGFPFEFVIASFAINLLYQFFLHTEAIGKLGFIEGVLATPSAHRVHHGSNDEYIDKNFGGVLIIWDRLFGTYEVEKEKPVYGVTTGFISNNPFVLIVKGFVDFFKGRMNYKG
jgi:sterol desaturase/sphingolipid hydroxylase (fatty acid hydroxylase superfamily)